MECTATGERRHQRRLGLNSVMKSLHLPKPCAWPVPKDDETRSSAAVLMQTASVLSFANRQPSCRDERAVGDKPGGVPKRLGRTSTGNFTDADNAAKRWDEQLEGRPRKDMVRCHRSRPSRKYARSSKRLATCQPLCGSAIRWRSASRPWRLPGTLFSAEVSDILIDSSVRSSDPAQCLAKAEASREDMATARGQSKSIP